MGMQYSMGKQCDISRGADQLAEGTVTWEPLRLVSGALELISAAESRSFFFKTFKRNARVSGLGKPFASAASKINDQVIH